MPPLDAERRRAIVIAIFVVGSVVTALVLAFLYAQPSIG
jgi:hypothetical protein